MNATQLERAAYICAHRMMTEDTSHPKLACPGGRRSRTIDSLAQIIIQTFSVHNRKLDGKTDWDMERGQG